MARRAWVPALALGALLALGAGAWWWQRGAEPGRAAAGAPPDPSAASKAGRDAANPAGGGSAPMVELATVRTLPIRDSASAVGSLRSRQSVMLRPEVAGRVTQLNLRDGERVRRGQLLVQLDERLAQAQVQQSRAELGIAESNHRRNVDLAGQGFISARAVDESQAALAVARAKLELAQATAARLKVVAPFGGVAGIGNVHVGDVLQAGADIVHLEDLDAMVVDFRLPERELTRLRRGQISQVRLDALPGHGFEAVVQAIDPQVDAEGRSVAVRACLDNREGLLRPGMFARVDIAFAERPDAVMLPEEAVVPLGGKFYVYRLSAPAPAAASAPASASASAAAAATREVVRTEVQLGARRAGLVEASRGLAAGDRVVVAGQQRLSAPTVRVRLAPASSAPADAAAPPSAAGSAAGLAADETPGLQWHRAARGGNPCAIGGQG